MGRTFSSDIAKEYAELKKLNGTRKAGNQRGAFGPFKNLMI